MRTSVTASTCGTVAVVETAGRALAFGLALAAAACATAPPVPIAPAAPTYEQKLASILRLEDERRLRLPAPPTPPVEAAPRGRRAAPSPPPPPPPDLIRLLGDPEARVRRRAALAVGRVGSRDGVQPLAALLADPDPEVRQMAAFAMGLVGDARGRDPLVAALADPQPMVQGSAAEALGLIGDAAAAAPLARLASQIVSAGAIAQTPADGEDARRDTPTSTLRLAIVALTRLKAYDALASVVLDAGGQPRVRWWPVAFALQRLEDPRAKTALLALARDGHPYTRAFAVKGLGAVGARDGQTDPAVSGVLVPLVTGPDHLVAIEALRALGRLGDAAAVPALTALLQNQKADPALRLEAVIAAGAMPAGTTTLDDPLLDALADPSPPIRGAALRAIARRDAFGFMVLLSGLDPDPDWSVRAALATALGTLTPEAGAPRLRALLDDPDARVVPAAVAAWARLKPAGAQEALAAKLKAEDAVVRAAAARALGEVKASSAGAALADAYRAGQNDTTYVARAAALGALSDLRAPEAAAVLAEALADKDWAVRVRAAALLKGLDPASDADARIRPAPTSLKPEDYAAARLVAPPFSTQCYIDTDRGTIQLELAVLDAPVTVDTFVSLARRGFFDGLTFHRVVPGFVVQAGDPRGDSEGGPGFTIRDELNEHAYVRGAVGMALDWADTGGSQFFITQSPQPHLDAKYTVFGRVLSGMDVVDRLQAGDVIRRVRIWDGTP